MNFKTKAMRQFLLIPALILFASCIMNAQTYYINSGDMETWETLGSTPNTYEHPVGWDSPNAEMAVFSAGTVVSKSTDANGGTYSAKIETKLVFTYTVPGVLVNGDFTAVLATSTIDIKGGDTCTVRPEKFLGYYKYTPSSGDSCVIVAGLFKRNLSTGFRDTIATATFYQSGTVSTWTAFEVDFDYQSSETPDSILVVASSSNAGAPVAGSVLYVDDFSFTGNVVGLNNPEINNTDIFSDPSKKQICFRNIPENDKSYSLVIYNTLGNQVYNKKFSNVTDLNVSTSKFNNGLYIIELSNDTQKIVKKLIINQ